MAKQIKAIKCPHCGSIGKTEVKADHFKCTSCNTEYYLDNDDININHNINFNSSTPFSDPSTAKRIGLVVGGVVAVFILFTFIIPSLFSSRKSYPAKENVRAEYSWYSTDVSAYANKDGRPIVVVLGVRRYSGDDHENETGEYISFYDLLTDKELKTQKTGTFSLSNGNNFELKQFSDNNFYGIANKERVYKIDKENLLASDVTQSLFKDHAKLASGIANAAFAYDSYGEAFNVMSNEGTNVFFYPMVNKIYTMDEVYVEKRKLEVAVPNEVLQTRFEFSHKSDDYPEEKIQLFKYTKRDTKGGPDDNVILEWQETASTHEKNITFGTNIMRSYVDLTPGRLYFNPKVLYSDDNYVIITSNKTAAESAPTNIQCIDARDGKLIFTYPFPTNQNFSECIKYKDGFVVGSYNFFLAIGLDGKLIKEFKIK